MRRNNGTPTIKLLLLICFALMVSSCGCVHTPQVTSVTSLDLILSASLDWDDDPDPDGLQFRIIPKDSNGFVVKAEGTVSAKLWSQQNTTTGEKGKLIQEWNNMRIAKRDYDKELTPTVRLEYGDYSPFPGEFGTLEVVMTTPDGKRFTHEVKDITLKYFAGIRVLPQPACSPQPGSGCCP